MQILSEGQGGSRLPGGETKNPLPASEAVEVSHSSRRSRALERYSSVRDQSAMELPIVTTVWGTELGTTLPIGLTKHH
jgi:hypothetical protein